MKKYVCPMGCIEPQDQPGYCFECGMKLLPTDQFGFKTDKNGYKISKNPHKSVSDPYIFVDPHKSVHYPHKSVSISYAHKSVPYPHKSVDTYLYFVEGHIPIMALLYQKCLQVHLECQDLKLKNGKFIQSKMVKIK
jgi:hypothetical protein